MLGQMIIATFAGQTPTPSLLARIRQGQVGGVILFADNVAAGVTATRELTRQLQSAAAQGRNPPLLIMTDQEGGTVKRLVGPPSLAAADMDSATVAFDQGTQTGQLLRSAGINIDLAPVADVEQVSGSFLGTRSFGSDPAVVANRACAFARGLAAAGVGYTLKHFPGLGLATGNTDTRPVSIDASAAALRADNLPYSTCGLGSLALVMVSSAIYPNLSGPLPAVMSPEIYRHELPLDVHGRSPPTISDDLQSGAIAAQVAPEHAVLAGLDLLLYAQTEQASADSYGKLLAEARAGSIPTATLRAADRKIRALKRRLIR
jgi:beta-N-acetylhexosaminidase